MDYSNLECYNAFTLGQKDRIHFSIENQRPSLLDSKACQDPCLNPITSLISVSNTTINIGETLNFSNISTGASSYQWLIDGMTFSNSSTASYTFNDEGTYTISLIANNSDPNCEEITTVEIEVICPVVASFITSGSDVKPGTEVFFTNISQHANSYQWLLNGMTISMNYNFSTVFNNEGTYDIQLIASNGLCSDTTSIRVITVSEFGITGTGLPIWPVTSSDSGVIETVDWQSNEPEIKIISEDGDNPSGQTGVAINACGELAFYAIQTGSSDPNHLNLYLPDGTELLSENTPNGPGLNGVRGNSETQVIRVPSFSNEWYIIYSKWSTDVGAPINNAAYNAAKLLYARVRLNDAKNLVVLQRDVELEVNGTAFTYTDGKAVSRTAYGSRDQHFFYACRRAEGSNTVSLDRFLITIDDIKWEKNTGTVGVPWWYLTMAGSPIELSPTEDRIAVTCRNQDRDRPDVLIFNSDTFSSSDYISITAGDLVLVADGTSNDLSSALPYDDKVKNIAYDNNLNLLFLRNYERKLSRMEFSPNGRFLYLNAGGYGQGGSTNVSYLSQIDLESSPMNVRMQIQTTSDGIYNPTTGLGCPTASPPCLDAYPAIGDIQSSYDGKLYFTKRHDNKYYVVPNPNDILPQNLVPSNIDLATAIDENIEMNGRTSSMPDQIDGHNYTDERFTKIEFNTNALDCNDECLAPYEVDIYLGDNLIESFIAQECPDTFEFCGDTTKIYSVYSPLVNLRYDSAIVYGQVNYPDNLTYFDFSDLSGCVEVCDNGIDDDNDGLLDCDDPDLQDSCCCFIPPILDLGPDIEICVNGVFTLDASDQFASYKWSDLTTESTTTVFEPGKYWVEVTDTCGGIQVDSINILWSPITQVDLGEDISICNGESVDLELTGFTTYNWSPSVGIDCSDCEKITFNPDTSTAYIVVAEMAGCYSVDTINVFVSQNTYEVIDTSICSNETITIGNVELEVGDSQLFFLQNSVGCDSTLEITVNDIGFPSYEQYIDTLICQNESIFLLGNEYSVNTKDTLRLQTFLGCDSTFFINVAEFPAPSTRDTISICHGEYVEIFGNEESVSGDYSDVFASQFGCDSSHTTTLIVQDEIIVVAETVPSCHDENNGSVELVVSGGVEPYTYEWGDGVTDENIVENLEVGEYHVIVTDGNNCETLNSFTIESLNNIELAIDIEENICFGESDGLIDLSGNPLGLTYSFNDVDYTEEAVFDSLPAGFYEIYAQDEYGCRYYTSVEINELDEIYVQLPEDTLIQFGESVTIIPTTNADGVLVYEWPISEGLDCDDCLIPIARPFDDMLYTLNIMDENGCEATDEMLVQIERKKQVFIPNVFSPNGDNINDYFIPSIGPGVKSIVKMDVYDRWGGMMFENSNFYPDDLAKGWNGTCNGKDVNPGVFVYLIQVEFIDGLIEAYSGDITIVR